jgi:hypothetical protein
MIRIKIELVPHGNEALTETLGKILIINDGKEEMIHKGQYKKFPRALGFWRLIQEIFRITPKEKI